MRNNDTGSPLHREPMPGMDEAQHSRRVHAHIAAAITEAGGWLSFEAYMDMVLYAPGLGYYSAGASKLGAAGDFVTAPEMSRLFGSCVARQCAEVLAALRSGGILEIGAGSGRLAGDILECLGASDRLPAFYWILEVSADLRQRQRAYLREVVPHLLDRIRWLDTPPADDFDGVIVANEVLDALPVTRFRWTRAQTEELGVGLDGGRFVWAARPADDAIAGYCRRLRRAGGDWPEGYVSEFCPRLVPWAANVTRGLRNGAVLWCDYGLPRAQYYFPERCDGTLLCHFRQRAGDDPFRHPGLQDITAWVDFSLLAEAGAEAGFRLAGFTTQAHFLAGIGIDREMQRLAGADQNEFARLAAQARRLMLPGEMGERFKAMAWTRGLELDLSGFALRDFRDAL